MCLSPAGGGGGQWAMTNQALVPADIDDRYEVHERQNGLSQWRAIERYAPLKA